MWLRKISSRGRVTIPKEIREKLGLRPGDRVEFIKKEGVLLLQPVKRDFLSLMGSVEVDGRQDFAEVRKETIRRKVDPTINGE